MVEILELNKSKICQQVLVENKKKNDSLSLPCYPMDRQSLLRKIPIENERKKKERKKNTDRTLTKLNAPHVRYNVKILPQYSRKIELIKKFREKSTGINFQIFNGEIFQNLRKYMLFKSKMQVKNFFFPPKKKTKTIFYGKPLIYQ